MQVASTRYELCGGLLYRRVYSRMDDEIQLRCYAPDVASRYISSLEGMAPMNFRNELILEYHVSRGHLGASRPSICWPRTGGGPRCIQMSGRPLASAKFAEARTE